MCRKISLTINCLERDKAYTFTTHVTLSYTEYGVFCGQSYYFRKNRKPIHSLKCRNIFISRALMTTIVIIFKQQIAPLDMKGCICHFKKWQIHFHIQGEFCCLKNITIVVISALEIEIFLHFKLCIGFYPVFFT